MVADPLAATQPGHDVAKLVNPLPREDTDDRLPDHLLRGVAIQTLGGLVPAGDDAIQRLADDDVVRGFDDGGEALAVDGGTVPFRDVAQDGKGDRTRRQLDDCGPGLDWDDCAVLAPQLQLTPPAPAMGTPESLDRRPISFGRDQIIESRAEKLIALVTEQLTGRSVDIPQPALGIDGQDGVRYSLDQ